MATTVAVKDETLLMLKEMKEKTHAESFDEVIQQLVLQAKKPKTSARLIVLTTNLSFPSMKEIAFFPLAEPWKYSIQILESSKTINFFPLKCA